MSQVICIFLSAFFWALAFKYWQEYRALKREEAKYK